MVAQWMVCDFAGGSSKSRLEKDGRTNEWAYLAYSNLVVITPLDVDDLNASIVATKSLVNALR